VCLWSVAESEKIVWEVLVLARDRFAGPTTCLYVTSVSLLDHDTEMLMSTPNPI
jgi:hypothetical protein